MEAKIEINLEVSSGSVLDDIVQHLESVLPYMADDVIITSRVVTTPIQPSQRSALFATFGEVFADTSNESRYAFTRLILGKPADAVVSWSGNKPGAISAAEASMVLHALDNLNV